MFAWDRSCWLCADRGNQKYKKWKTISQFVIRLALTSIRNPQDRLVVGNNVPESAKTVKGMEDLP
jgi:hypothetical protein